MKSIYDFFDRTENKVRAKLSHYPVAYACVGGVGVVIFWRGIWHTADFITQIIFSFQQSGSINLGNLPWWDGPLSIVVGSVLLLSTGLFVLDFLGSEAIISGLKGEKKIEEKTEKEVKTEKETIEEIGKEVKEISQHLDNLEKDLEQKKQ